MLCHECHRTLTIVCLLFALKNQSLFQCSFDCFDVSLCCAGNRRRWIILFVGEFDFLLLENVCHGRYSYEKKNFFSLSSFCQYDFILHCVCFPCVLIICARLQVVKHCQNAKFSPLL